MKLTKKFIKENPEMKLKELLKPTLEVGMWYKNDFQQLFCFQGTFNDERPQGYGFCRNDEWIDYDLKEIGFNSNFPTLANPEEIKNALEKEAVKRGFETCKYYSITNGGTIILRENSFRIAYDEYSNKLLLNNWSIFQKGTWAQIIKPKQMTIQEIEKELGY